MNQNPISHNCYNYDRKIRIVNLSHYLQKPGRDLNGYNAMYNFVPVPLWFHQGTSKTPKNQQDTISEISIFKCRPNC